MLQNYSELEKIIRRIIKDGIGTFPDMYHHNLINLTY